MSADELRKEMLDGISDDAFAWIAAKFGQRYVAQATSCYTTATAVNLVEARELAKPGRRDIRNNRIIANFPFLWKWFLTSLELNLVEVLGGALDEAIGGVAKGKTTGGLGGLYECHYSTCGYLEPSFSGK